MSNEIQVIDDKQLINVLQNSLYPGASAESCALVLQYCKAAKLDPMMKPVHIVPMWDSKLGRMRDVIMPGIALYRIQAERSGEFLGCSQVEFGPMVTIELGGINVKVPEFAKITAKRAVGQHIAEHTAVEYFVENYAEKGGKDKSKAPNTMWLKRPRGQLAKCAEAQALRRAFPELAIGETAEEMEEKTLYVADFEAEAIVIDTKVAEDFIEQIQHFDDEAELMEYWQKGSKAIAEVKDRQGYDRFKNLLSEKRLELIAVKEKAASAALVPDLNEVIDIGNAPEVEREPGQDDDQQSTDEFVAGLDKGAPKK